MTMTVGSPSRVKQTSSSASRRSQARRLYRPVSTSVSAAIFAASARADAWSRARSAAKAIVSSMPSSCRSGPADTSRWSSALTSGSKPQIAPKSWPSGSLMTEPA